MGTFSFFPGKNMGAMGDAGAIICNNKKLFDKISRYRNHGSLKNMIILLLELTQD